jgi:hypothetical protein
VHFLRNVLARAPKGNAEIVAAAVRTVVAQPDAEHVHVQLDVIAGMLNRQFPSVKQMWCGRDRRDVQPAARLPCSVVARPATGPGPARRRPAATPARRPASAESRGARRPSSKCGAHASPVTTLQHSSAVNLAARCPHGSVISPAADRRKPPGTPLPVAS